MAVCGITPVSITAGISSNEIYLTIKIFLLTNCCLFLSQMNVFLYIMASRASCSLKQKSCEKRDVPA